MGKRKPNNGDLFVAIIVLILFPIFKYPEAVKEFTDKVIWVLKIGATIGLVGLLVFFVYLVFSRNSNSHTSISSTTQLKNKPIQKHQAQYKNNHYEKQKIVTPQSKNLNPENKSGWSIELINSLEWKRFEDLCAGYFQEKGYRAIVTPHGADGGIDINLFKDSYSPAKPFGIVQCKAWNSYKVGVKPIRELYGVMAAEKTPLGVFITSGTYTEEAKKFSAGKHLKLLAGNSLLELIESLPDENKQNLLKKITDGDYSTPSCPSCGTKMKLRISKKGKTIGNKFWGCKNFPRCRNTLNIANKRKEFG